MQCELCERCSEASEDFEKHHLFPVKQRRQVDTTILTCKQCGDEIHQQLTNSELQSYYHTAERLREKLSSYLLWVKNKPITQHFSVARKKRR
jgi:hypothetical protein